MKRNKIMLPALAGVIFLSPLAGQAAQSNTSLFDKPAASGAPLFGDNVVAKGKGIEIRQSQVDEMYTAFKGHRAAMGVAIPDDMRPRIEADIIDKLVATRLFLQRATPEDKAKAKEVADAFIAEQKKQTLSEDSYRRQLMAVGMTPAEFASQIQEQAIVKVVIDREIKVNKKVTDQQARKYYDDNPSLFEEPEQVRAAHILVSTRDPITKKELTPEAKLAKKRSAEKILTRARAGEDFGKLAKQFSEDPGSKDSGGEYTFPRAKADPRRAMVPEFEAAAFSMKPGQISDLVETSYGYHIIKTIEKIPAKRIGYPQVEGRIKDTLLREEVEKALPEYVEKLKKEAGVQILVSANKE